MLTFNFVKPYQSFHQMYLQGLHNTQSFGLCIIILYINICDKIHRATSGSSLVVYSKLY